MAPLARPRPATGGQFVMADQGRNGPLPNHSTVWENTHAVNVGLRATLSPTYPTRTGDTPCAEGTPQCAPSAGPSGGGNEAGKPSGGRRKGDPRQGRRVAPGRRRSHQSEGLSRQFGKAVGLLRAAASALNPPPSNRRWAIRHGRPRAERPPRESFRSRPAGGQSSAGPAAARSGKTLACRLAAGYNSPPAPSGGAILT